MPWYEFAIFGGSFALIWVGSGLIVSSVDKISKKLKLSRFAISFGLLGVLTSTPEFAVGLTAVASHRPEIFVGTLLGGVVVIFALIIPVLAMLGGGIKLRHELSEAQMISTLLVVMLPAAFVLDRRVTNAEGLIMVVSYALLVMWIESKKGFLDGDNSKLLKRGIYSLGDLMKVVLGVGILYVASNQIVDKTLFFSQLFNINAFYISLILLSFGTNLPELSLAVRSVLVKKKDVAFGDYLGSVAANTLLFGLFTLMTQGEVLTVNHFLGTFIFIAVCVWLFYFFSRTKSNISRKEGFILILVYVMFVIWELFG